MRSFKVDDTLTPIAANTPKFQAAQMNGEEKIFLTQTQAIHAVHFDFNQYGSQFDLFQELLPIISDNKIIAAKDGKNSCMLIIRGHKSKTQHMRNNDLGDYLFNTLNEKLFPLSIIAIVCSKVFRTKSWVGTDNASGIDGIWLKTEMAHFKCRQCGNCCQNLKYHNECSENDYKQWKALNRKDILEKIISIHSDSQPPQFKIWKKPGTNRFYEKCPWLKPAGFKARYECRIHDFKPEFCRQYPLTRKHAMMTGCKGIFKEQV